MRPGLRLLPLVLWLGIVGATTSPSLPPGNDHFWLGMSRAHVDSAVSARGLGVISSGLTFLACRSDDPAIEFEQYSFFPMPHGTLLLWKVTLGYRIGTSREGFRTARDQLRLRLGDPTSLSDPSDTTDQSGPEPDAMQAVWADPFTIVQLAARWSETPDLAADRMMVTWTDRRLQRLVDAHRKKLASGSK